MIRLYVVLITVVLVFGIGCSSSDDLKNMNAQERFDHGKALFDEGEYTDAKKDFEQIKLQFPGNSVADDAMYYLAECYYHREEFLLASEEYKSIKRNLQGSPFLPLAQFKIAMCFYNLAPQSHLDQEYSVRAIDAFQTFIEYYPTHELVADATQKIRELNGRLAEKDYNTGELYMRLSYYKSAIYYFTSVVEKFHDTKFAEPAHLKLARALYQRKLYKEANKEIESFLQKYPKSEEKDEALSLKNDIQEKLQMQPVKEIKPKSSPSN